MGIHKPDISKQISASSQQVSVACRSIWKSGDQMSWDLAEYGVEISPRTAQSYRLGETEPRYSLGEAILAVVEIKIEQEIANHKARLDAIRRRT